MSNVQNTIQEAIVFLAGRCNYAMTLDNKGFNKTDSEFGHSIADQIEAGKDLTAKQIIACSKKLRKYQHTQLAPVGILLPTQEEIDEYLSSLNTQQSEIFVDRETRQIIVAFQYDRDLVMKARSFMSSHQGKGYGTYQGKKGWGFYVTSQNLDVLISDLGETFQGFTFSDEILAKYNHAAAA